ncbi:MAG: DUF4286 family protein [Flavobacteriales bacterium]
MNKVLYNVTCSVDPQIHEEWLDWMKFVHVPEVMATGFFTENKICRIHEYEENGVTYAIQYVCKSKRDLDQYHKEKAPALQQAHTDRYGNKVSAFRTVLEIIHEQKIPYVDVYPN